MDEPDPPILDVDLRTLRYGSAIIGLACLCYVAAAAAAATAALSAVPAS